MKVQFKLDKQKSPTIQQGMKVTYGEAKRAGYRVRWFLLIASIIGPSLAGVYWLLRPQVLTIAPGVVSYHAVAMNVSRDSVVEEISVEVGDEVSKDTVLVELSDSVLDSEITYLEEEIRKLRAFLLEREDVSISLHDKAVSDALRNYLQVRKIKQKYDKFAKQGQVSTSDYASVLATYSAAEKQLSEAKIQLAKAQMDLRNDLVSGDVAKTIRSLESQLLVKEAQRAELTLKAPFDARVIQVVEVEGQDALENDQIVTVADKHQAPEIMAYLDAKFVDKAEVNDEAKVILPNGDEYQVIVSKPTELSAKLPAHLAKPFEGQQALMQISLAFVEIPPETSELIEGMPVEVRF